MHNMAGKSQPKHSKSKRRREVETPASVPGRNVSHSLWQHGGAITHSKPACFNYYHTLIHVPGPRRRRSAPLSISPKMIGCWLYNNGRVRDWDLKDGSQFTSMLNTRCGLRWKSPGGSFCLLMPQASVPKARGADPATFRLSFYIFNLRYSFIPLFHIFNFFLATYFWSCDHAVFSAGAEHLESTEVSMLSRVWRKSIHLKAPMQKTVSSLDQIAPDPDCRRRCAAFEMTFTWLTDDIILLIRAESQFPMLQRVPVSLMAANMLTMPFLTTGLWSKCTSMRAPPSLPGVHPDPFSLLPSFFKNEEPCWILNMLHWALVVNVFLM